MFLWDVRVKVARSIMLDPTGSSVSEKRNSRSISGVARYIESCPTTKSSSIYRIPHLHTGFSLFTVYNFKTSYNPQPNCGKIYWILPNNKVCLKFESPTEVRELDNPPYNPSSPTTLFSQPSSALRLTTHLSTLWSIANLHPHQVLGPIVLIYQNFQWNIKIHLNFSGSVSTFARV